MVHDARHALTQGKSEGAPPGTIPSEVIITSPAPTDTGLSAEDSRKLADWVLKQK